MTAVLAVSGCSWLERSSVSSAPASRAGGFDSRGPSLSQSGRYVAFTSDAADLVPGDTNGASDVFVRDNVAHTTTRVSVAGDGRQGNGPSYGADISDDGRTVAFLSQASNLAPGDTDTAPTIFVADRVTHAIEVASVGSDERPIGTVASAPVLSGDGSTVAFTLVTGFPDVAFSVPYGPVVRHLDTGTTADLRLAPPIGYAAVMPGPPSLSDDGSRIASIPYQVSGTTALGGASVRDTTTGAFVADLGRVDVPIAANRGAPIAISGDGTRFAVGFVPAPGASTSGAIRVGRVADPASARTVTSEFAMDVALSDTGSLLATRTHTVFGDVAMVTDPAQGDFRLVSSNAAGSIVAVVTSIALSGDGRWIAFDSAGTDIAPGDARGVTQIYTRSAVRSTTPPS